MGIRITVIIKMRIYKDPDPKHVSLRDREYETFPQIELVDSGLKRPLGTYDSVPEKIHLRHCSLPQLGHVEHLTGHSENRIKTRTFVITKNLNNMKRLQQSERKYKFSKAFNGSQYHRNIKKISVNNTDRSYTSLNL